MAAIRFVERRLAHGGSTLVSAAIASAVLTGCYPPVKSTLDTPPSPSQMSELWNEPEPGRDLFYGVGGARLAPDPDARYTVLEVKHGGFSSGYTVEDPQHRKWSAKFYPEAHTEVVASRILWALGYHQPPVYFLETWEADNAPVDNPQTAARFREKTPDFHGMDEGGNWSYFQNPFVGTRPMNGLLVLQVLLGNSDLKDEQNAVYILKEPVEGAARWYVARDLGQTFGRTGILNAPRDDLNVFDQTPFILGVKDGIVKFDYRGRHDPLFEHITPADVRWICSRLDRLTDAQWNDMFRAGGYSAPIIERYVRRLKQKIAEGLALQG